MLVRRAGRGKRAGIAQLVEYKLPKLGVAGSNPVARSIIRPFRPASLFEVVGPVQGKPLLQIADSTLASSYRPRVFM